LRHLRVFWDAHRYRIAPQIEKILHHKQQDGSLRVLTASLTQARRAQDKLRLEIRPRRRAPDACEVISVDHVIITTGPSHNTVVDQNSALKSLSEQGLLQRDELGLGVAVDARGQVYDARGQSGPTLLVVGPLARAAYGELMGLPQVAAQPNAVARDVAAYLAARAMVNGVFAAG
jgi:uncharacterized NAD(P)/FAD-binding protein YdhS